MTKSIFILCFFVSSQSFAQGFPSLFSGQKRGAEDNTRWTISDYMMQKQRVGMSNMWLAMNRSKSIFEMVLGGGPIHYHLDSTVGGVTTSSSQHGQAYQLSMHVWIFGIQGEYETTDDDMEIASGALAIRLFGTSQQNTSLTVKYGLRQTTDSSVTPENEWRNQFAEAELTLYIVQFFGINGSYRHYFSDTSSTDIEMSGTRATAGAFIDVGFLRLYGDFFQETFDRDKAGTITTKEREGIQYGARLYF